MKTLAQAIEHTGLKPDLMREDALRLCREAIDHGFHGVCVNPLWVETVSHRLAGSGVRVVSVVGFPLGGSLPEVVALEAERAAAQGADEIDMVVPIGLARNADWNGVTSYVRKVRRAVPSKILKVILETGYFATSEIPALCTAVLEGGADFLKTSTGLGPRGATLEDVALLVQWAAGKAQVKAAGGIRTLADAQAFLAAGATRLGTSCGVAIVSGAAGGAAY